MRRYRVNLIVLAASLALCALGNCIGDRLVAAIDDLMESRVAASLETIGN